MDKIKQHVIFKLEICDINCSRYYEKQYISSPNFYTDEKLRWRKSTVGSGERKQNILNVEVRSSDYWNLYDSSIYLSDRAKQEAKNNMCEIIPKKYNPQNTLINPFYKNEDDNNEIEWDLIRYKTGDYFKKHTDGKLDVGHFGTVLLIPPKNICPHEGGELVLYNEDNTDEKIIADQFKWVAVVLGINVPHEVLPVTEGTRYIFKSKICISEKYVKLIDTKILTKDKFVEILVDIRESIEFDRRELHNYKIDINFYEECQHGTLGNLDEIITKLENNIDELKFMRHNILLDGIITSSLETLKKDDDKSPNIKNGNNTNDNFVIILKGYYKDFSNVFLDKTRYLEEDICYLTNIFKKNPEIILRIRNDTAFVYLGESYNGDINTKEDLLSLDDHEQLKNGSGGSTLYKSNNDYDYCKKENLEDDYRNNLHISKIRFVDDEDFGSNGSEFTRQYDDSYYHYSYDKKITTLVCVQ